MQHIIAPTRRPDVVKATIKNPFLCNGGLFAAGLYTHEVFSSLDTGEQLIQAHLFLLLQIICMEYTEISQQLIEYSSGGDALMIKEQVDKAFGIALTEGFD